MSAAALLASVVQVVVAGWLFWTGLHKLADFSVAARQVGEYSGIPNRLARPATAFAIFAECGLATWLLASVAVALAAALSAVLLLAYATLISLDLLRGRRHACGCGGSTRPIAWWMVGRNAGMALLVAISGWAPSTVGTAERLLIMVVMALSLVCAVNVREARRQRLGLT